MRKCLGSQTGVFGMVGLMSRQGRDMLDAQHLTCRCAGLLAEGGEGLGLVEV